MENHLSYGLLASAWLHVRPDDAPTTLYNIIYPTARHTNAAEPSPAETGTDSSSDDGDGGDIIVTSPWSDATELAAVVPTITMLDTSMGIDRGNGTFATPLSGDATTLGFQTIVFWALFGLMMWLRGKCERETIAELEMELTEREMELTGCEKIADAHKERADSLQLNLEGQEKHVQEVTKKHQIERDGLTTARDNLATEVASLKENLRSTTADLTAAHAAAQGAKDAGEKTRESLQEEVTGLKSTLETTTDDLTAARSAVQEAEDASERSRQSLRDELTSLKETLRIKSGDLTAAVSATREAKNAGERTRQSLQDEVTGLKNTLQIKSDSLTAAISATQEAQQRLKREVADVENDYNILSTQFDEQEKKLHTAHDRIKSLKQELDGEKVENEALQSRCVTEGAAADELREEMDELNEELQKAKEDLEEASEEQQCTECDGLRLELDTLKKWRTKCRCGAASTPSNDDDGGNGSDDDDYPPGSGDNGENHTPAPTDTAPAPDVDGGSTHGTMAAFGSGGNSGDDTPAPTAYGFSFSASTTYPSRLSPTAPSWNVSPPSPSDASNKTTMKRERLKKAARKWGAENPTLVMPIETDLGPTSGMKHQERKKHKWAQQGAGIRPIPPPGEED